MVTTLIRKLVFRIIILFTIIVIKISFHQILKIKRGKFNFIKKYQKYMSIKSILLNYKSLIIYIVKSYF